jgi:Family of unknown function (DUF6518)
MSLAVVMHYVPFRLMRWGVTPQVFGEPFLQWVLLAGLAGAVIGSAGFSSKAPSVKGSWSSALLTSIFLAEALTLAVLVQLGPPYVKTSSSLEWAVPLNLVAFITTLVLIPRTWRERGSLLFKTALLAGPTLMCFATAVLIIGPRIY